MNLSPIFFTPVLDASFITSSSIQVNNGTRRVLYDPPPKYEDVVLDPSRLSSSVRISTPPPKYKSIVKEQLASTSSTTVD